MTYFEFKKDEGLFADGRIIADFDVVTNKRIAEYYYGKEEQEKKSLSYEIQAVTSNGTRLQMYQVRDFSKLNYFNMWSEINDAELSKSVRRLLKSRLQQTAKYANQIVKVHFNAPNIYKLQSGVKAYVVGDKFVSSIDQNSFIIADTPYRSRMRWLTDNKLNLTIHDKLGSYIKAAPGCSEIICYSVLFSAIKPFFVDAGINPCFAINVYGESGTYKTSIVKAMSYFIEDTGEVTGSIINDRKNSIFQKLKQAYGMTFVLDDFHPTELGYEKKRQLSLMDSVTRFIESNPKTALVIMTSEFLEGCFSFQDRVLQIKMTETSLEHLSNIQSSTTFLSDIAIMFVKSLISHYDQVMKDIQSDYLEMNKEIKGGYRTRRHAVFIKITAKLFAKYMCKGDYNECYYNQLVSALSKQVEIQEKRLKILKEVQSNIDYVQLFRKLIDSEIYSICSDIDNSYRATSNQIYFKDNIAIYVTKSALRYGINKYLGANAIEVASIIKALHENDLLLEDKDAIAKKFFGVRHLCISRYALDNYIVLKKRGEI